MKRKILKHLLTWKSQPKRKPLLLDGARQTGKSYLLERLFSQHFNNLVRLDFMEQPNLASLFEDSLNSDDILDNIELTLNVEIDPDTTLIVFDEIGECQAAVNSLKFFAEQKPNMFICASGSNIGLLDSFPVGKVEFVTLHPLTFEEFLWASDQPALLKAYDKTSFSKAAHDKLFSLLIDYYFVGGMPEAVSAWFELKNASVIERTQRVADIHAALIAGYERDFGKYSNKMSAQHINAVFRNVPTQLASNMDDSVKRFRFKEVVEKKTRYQQLSGPIDWLAKCRLVSKCQPIESEPSSPLATLAKENIFKLFLFDIGLLGHLLGLTYQEHRAQGFNYKGYIAENFVQNELIAIQSHAEHLVTYSWEYARSEIEFLYKTDAGDILPIEVKSGKRTRAKSLSVYVDRYSPNKTIKLIGSTGSVENPNALVLPLYYTAKIPHITKS